MMQGTNKERERVQSQWIKCKQQDVFRGSSTQLYIPVFTEKDSNPLTCPPRTPTEGTSTEDFGQIQLGVPNSSLNQYNLHRGNTITTSHKRGRPLSKQPQIHLTKRDTNPNSISHQREHTTISTFTKEGANHNPNQPLPKRDTTSKGFTNQWFPQPQTIFPQINDPIEQDRVIQLKWKTSIWKSKAQGKLLGK